MKKSLKTGEQLSPLQRFYEEHRRLVEGRRRWAELKRDDPARYEALCRQLASVSMPLEKTLRESRRKLNAETIADRGCVFCRQPAGKPCVTATGNRARIHRVRYRRRPPVYRRPVLQMGMLGGLTLRQSYAPSQLGLSAFLVPRTKMA